MGQKQAKSNARDSESRALLTDGGNFKRLVDWDASHKGQMIPKEVFCSAIKKVFTTQFFFFYFSAGVLSSFLTQLLSFSFFPAVKKSRSQYTIPSLRNQACVEFFYTVITSQTTGTSAALGCLSSLVYGSADKRAESKLL